MLRLKSEVARSVFCANCRKSNPVGSLFCTHCGTTLQDAPPPGSPSRRKRVRFNIHYIWILLLAGLTVYASYNWRILPEWLNNKRTLSSIAAELDPLMELKARAVTGELGALVELGDTLCSTTGPVRNVQQAFKYYLKAADGGHKLAGDVVAMALAGKWQPELNAATIWAWIRESAEFDNKEACYQLGLLYRDNQAYGIDNMASMAWLKKASDGGHQKAMLNLAKIYYSGNPNVTNRQESVRLLSYIDYCQHPEAAEMLGVMNIEGDGTPTDVAKGMTLLEVAATNGRPQAATRLGRIYLAGEVIPVDESRALEWFVMAGELGDVYGRAKAGLMIVQSKNKTHHSRGRELLQSAISNNQLFAFEEIYAHVTDDVLGKLKLKYPPITTNDIVDIRRLNGTIVRGAIRQIRTDGLTLNVNSNMTTASFVDYDVTGRIKYDPQYQSIIALSMIVEQVYALVSRLEMPPKKTSDRDLTIALSSSGVNDDPDAQAWIGNRMLREPARAREGINLLIKAAEAGSADGQYLLGMAQYTGFSVLVNKKEAYRLFSMASEQGHANALFAKGRMMIAGDGCDKNFKDGMDIIRRSAEMRNVDGILLLGKYCYGDGAASRDAAQSFAWFRLGAMLAVPEAQYWLGRMYYEGRGVAADNNRAIQWLVESASNGFRPAAALLANDLSHKNNLAAARDAYQVALHMHGQEIERIRTDPKYDVVLKTGKLPSGFSAPRRVSSSSGSIGSGYVMSESEWQSLKENSGWYTGPSGNSSAGEFDKILGGY